MRIIIHNFHHSFHHRGRRGHRGYSGGNIFTHSSDTDCLSVFWKKCRKFFSLPSFPFLPSLSFLSSVSSASSVVKIVMKTVMNLLLCLLLLSSCYYKAPALDSEELSKKTKDSLTYLYERHYTWNTNLEVVDDSISLECLPIKDTFIQLNKGDRVVVAEFAVHPADSVDSVWVKLAHTQDEQGWIREKELKKSFVPTDSISQAIHLFSDTHASYFIIIFALFVGVYLFRAFRRKQLHICARIVAKAPFSIGLFVSIDLFNIHLHQFVACASTPPSSNFPTSWERSVNNSPSRFFSGINS